MWEAATDEKENSEKKWKAKMQSKIDKHIMTSVDTVRWVFVNREKWMTEVFRDSEKTIRPVSEEEMHGIIKQRCNSSLPEIPASDESFHFLHLEDIATVFLPEEYARYKCQNNNSKPENITVLPMRHDVTEKYSEDIHSKDYPSEIAACPVDDESPYNPEDNIPESLVFSLVDEYSLMEEWQHDEYKACQIVRIPEARKCSVHIETRLIKRCKRIESYFLKKCIDDHSEKTNKAGVEELPSLGR